MHTGNGKFLTCLSDSQCNFIKFETNFEIPQNHAQPQQKNLVNPHSKHNRKYSSLSKQIKNKFWNFWFVQNSIGCSFPMEITYELYTDGYHEIPRFSCGDHM